MSGVPWSAISFVEFSDERGEHSLHFDDLAVELLIGRRIDELLVCRAAQPMLNFVCRANRKM